MKLHFSILILLVTALPCVGQEPTGAAERPLHSAVTVDEADAGVRAQLDRARQLVREKQGAAAVEIYRRLLANSGDRMLRFQEPASVEGEKASDGFVRYMTVRQFCQLEIAALGQHSPGALTLYRQRVDPLVTRRYNSAIAAHDEGELTSIVEQSFASTVGDQALFALGEMALGRGDYTAARRCWSALDARLDIDPFLPDYPKSKIPVADVAARLVIASILEGSFDRARTELAQLQRLAPKAEGRISGRTVPYDATLQEMLAEEEKSARQKTAATSDWLTFAGAPTRNHRAPHAPEITPTGGRVISIGPRDNVAGSVTENRSLMRPVPVGEDATGRLSTFAVIADGNVFLLDRTSVPGMPEQVKDRIRVLRLSDGRPLWPESSGTGEIYSHVYGRAPKTGRHVLGEPRRTWTVYKDKLFARVGTAETARPIDQPPPTEQGMIIGLDLAAQGRMMEGFPIRPEGPQWAFEGTPVTDGHRLLVAQRRADVRTRAYVACYEIGTGRLLWRRMICEAATPGHGRSFERTNNLLTLAQGVVYYNTNLGTVAAVRARDGRVLWITGYPRTSGFSLDDEEKESARFYRDMNPCLFDRGRIYVAPWDSNLVFALDASSGRVLWNDDRPNGIVNMLCISDDSLVLSGRRLWWMDSRTGRVTGRFPEAQRPDPSGHGRGMLAGGKIFWPTRETIFVFGANGLAGGKREINLAPLGATGGNMATDGTFTVIVSERKLFIFGQPDIK